MRCSTPQLTAVHEPYFTSCVRTVALLYSRTIALLAVYAPTIALLHYLRGALLALTDGKLADMQAAAEADGGVQQLNAAIESAQALGGRRAES